MHKGQKCIQILSDHQKNIPFVENYKECTICAILREKKHFGAYVDFLKVLLNFFSGARLVALLKGLFIPVWRQIHRSKIQPVTSWQLTNSRATGFCHEVI